MLTRADLQTIFDNNFKDPGCLYQFFYQQRLAKVKDEFQKTLETISDELTLTDVKNILLAIKEAYKYEHGFSPLDNFKKEFITKLLTIPRQVNYTIRDICEYAGGLCLIDVHSEQPSRRSFERLIHDTTSRVRRRLPQKSSVLPTIDEAQNFSKITDTKTAANCIKLYSEYKKIPHSTITFWQENFVYKLVSDFDYVFVKDDLWLTLLNLCLFMYENKHDIPKQLMKAKDVSRIIYNAFFLKLTENLYGLNDALEENQFQTIKMIIEYSWENCLNITKQSEEIEQAFKKIQL